MRLARRFGVVGPHRGRAVCWTRVARGFVGPPRAGKHSCDETKRCARARGRAAQCGPSNGPQCASCKRFDAAGGAAVVGGASGQSAVGFKVEDGKYKHYSGVTVIKEHEDGSVDLRIPGCATEVTHFSSRR